MLHKKFWGQNVIMLYLKKNIKPKMRYKKFWENFVIGKKLLRWKCCIKNFEANMLYLEKNY